MEPAFIVVVILFGILLIHHVRIKQQLRNLKKQLKYRQTEQTKSPLYLELGDKDLHALVAIMNQALEEESNLRIEKEISEREFKDLISNISHDLRTPLTVMKGYLQLMEECELEPQGREYLEVCFKHTEELERRVRQFFEYSFLVNQEENITLHKVNVTNLVTEIMTDFIPFFEEKGIVMKLEEETVVKALAEEESLKRVMQNLLKNCLNYGKGEVSVFIGEAEDKDKIQVCVKNQIAPGKTLDADKVFQRFYVGDPSRNQSTGLGLSIVKLLVEKMQGEVFARNEGGVFCIGFLLLKEENVG